MPAFICGIFVARYARARRRNDNIMFHLSRAARNGVSKFNQRAINGMCARVGARVLHDVPRARAVPPPHRVPNPTSAPGRQIVIHIALRTDGPHRGRSNQRDSAAIDCRCRMEMAIEMAKLRRYYNNYITKIISGMCTYVHEQYILKTDHLTLKLHIAS